MSEKPQRKPRRRRADAAEVERLVAVIEDVAQGKYSNDIMEFTKPGRSETIQRVAEAVGMMMVQVEAREFRLEQLIEDLRKLNALMKQGIIQTVITIANALGARDVYTRGHAQRVAAYAERLARRMGLPPEEVEGIRIGGMLHDIGKIGFSDRVFHNEDVKLAQDLLEEIHRHPNTGVAILKDLDFLGPVLDTVRSHHERADGTGYPQGLAGEQVPLGARIVGVADTFDAMTTDRPYQKGKTQGEAFAILRQIRGKAFSADVVDAFIHDVEENGMVEV